MTKANPFRVGDTVRVAADAKTSIGGGVYFGGEVTGRVTFADETDCSVEPVGGGFSQYVGPEYLTLVDRETIEVGDKVRIVSNSDSLRHYMPIGSIVTVHRAPAEARMGGAYVLRGRVVWDSDQINDDDTQYVERSDFEPILGDGGDEGDEGDEALREAVARAEKAERDLAELRERLTDSLSADTLEDLGLLPPLPGNFPVTQGSVVKLTEGRLAIRHDDDHEPWKVYKDGDVVPVDGRFWLTDRQVAALFVSAHYHAS